MTYKPSLDGTYTRKAASGFGFEHWLPDRPRSFDEVVETDDRTAIFTEVGRITRQLQQLESGGLLLWGEPGAGKSHIRDDLVVQTALTQDVPFLSVSLHINGSKSEGPANARQALETLAQVGEGKKLVIFDNVDYLGYRGRKSRTRAKATAYAAEMSELIQETVANPELAVMGMAHDPAWREGRWTWDDPAIDEPAAKALEAFTETAELTGELTKFGIVETLYERKLEHVEEFALQLAHDGMTTFFYVNHLDPELYKVSPERAVAAINQTREEMKHR